MKEMYRKWKKCIDREIILNADFLLWQVPFEPISELVPPAGGSEFGFHRCWEKPVDYKWNNRFNDKSQNGHSFNNYLGSRYTSSNTLPGVPLANWRCLSLNTSLMHTFIIKVNTYRWLSAIRATCTTKSFSKGP